MAKSFALVMDGQVMNVWRGLPDDTAEADVSPVNNPFVHECPDDAQPGWLYDAEQNSYSAPPEVGTIRTITPMDFMLRIPQEKRIAIRKYADGQGALAAAVPDYCDVVGDFLDLLRTAREIEIDGQLVGQGLGLLQTIGLISAEDVTAITA